MRDKTFVNHTKPKANYQRPKADSKDLNDTQLAYLKKRGFTEATIAKFKLFNGESGEVCIPFFKGGQLVNVKHRPTRKDKPMWQEKGAEPCLFNRDAVTGKTLTITEGEYDCIALDQYGIKDVTSVPSGTNDHRWIESEWEFLERFDSIYLCMDADQAGQDARDLLVNRLGRWRCKAVTFPYKDANDCLIKGVTREAIDKAFREAQEFPPSELRRAGDYYEEVFSMFLEPQKFNGTDTGFPGLNYYLRGWRKGETTVWSGQNGSGKTTILNEVCLFLAAQRVKSCVASLELRPARYLKWAVTQATGKEHPTGKDINSAFGWLNDFLFVVNICDEARPQQILDVFEYATRRYGVEHFVIDSLMRIALHGPDKYEAQREFVSQITTFAKKYQVHVHLIAHPRKGYSDAQEPNKVDISGTADITNLADNVIILWRPPDDKHQVGDPDAVMHIKKNREFGDCGGVRLYFDKKTKRLSCVDQEIIFHLAE